MDQAKEEKPPKRQTTRFSRSKRNRRIVEKVREGFAYDEIAREERLTVQHVRRIATEALEGREALEAAIHAYMQVDRARRALRAAGQALADGDVRAVAPFFKAVAKLDGHRGAVAGLDLFGQALPPEAPDLQALAEELAEFIEDNGNAAAAALATKLAALMKDTGVEARAKANAITGELADLGGCRPAPAPTPAEAMDANL